MKEKTAQREKTSFKLGFFYSFGEVGCQLSWYMVNTYLMLFYTDILGLTSYAISLIMLIARVWDAINDPLMGMIADRTRTRWGKFRPYITIAPAFLAIFNILTFTVFPVTGIAKIVLCLICYIGVGMSYTAISVSYGGLVNLIAKDSQVRMNYVSARAIGSSIIQMILSAAVMPLILTLGHSDTANATGYFWTTVLCSVVMLPCFWLCSWKCKETVVTINNYSHEKKPMLRSLKMMAKNKMLMITVFCVLMGTIAVMGRMSMLSYYVIYVMGSYTMISPIFTIMTFTSFIGCLFLPMGTKFFGKRNYLIILNVVMILGFVAMYFAPANNVAVILVISAIIGFTNSCSNICTGMLTDCVEYGDWKYGVREEGLTFSCLGFGVKLATAVAGSACVLLLSATGYVPNAEQTEAAKNGINAVVNLIPAACVALSIIPLFFYKLNSKTVAKIAEDLAARDAGKVSEKAQ